MMTIDTAIHRCAVCGRTVSPGEPVQLGLFGEVLCTACQPREQEGDNGPE